MTSHVTRVLIVEDEEMLRGAMAQGIAKIPNVEVLEAGTLSQALDFLDSHSPEVIFSDLDLPGRSGIELLGALAVRGMKSKIVFITAYLKAYGAHIPPHANVEVREKPVDIEELRGFVQARLATTQVPTPFAAADYLQLACMGGHSVVISVDALDGTSGHVTVHEGQVWAAFDRGMGGINAFRSLIMADGARTECRTLTDDPGPSNLEGSWEALLLDAARISDEDGAPPTLHVPSRVSEMPPPPSDDGFNELWSQATEAMLEADYARARQLLEQARVIRPDEEKVIRYIERIARKSMP